MAERGIQELKDFEDFDEFVDSLMFLKPSYLATFSHPDGKIGGPANGKLIQDYRWKVCPTLNLWFQNLEKRQKQLKPIEV